MSESQRRTAASERLAVLRPMLLLAALFTAAGGYVHLEQWLDGYRHVPASVPGAWLVSVGFPLNAAASFLAAIALILAATKLPRLLGPAFVAALALQVLSLAVLIATRRGSVFGWSEPSWTPGATRSRAVEIGALLALGVVAVVGRTLRQGPRRHARTLAA